MKKRILVVEYDTQIVEMIREILPPSAFDIIEVDEGQKAREVLSKNTFDLVITAAMLPKFHGFNLSQFIHEQYPETRIIIMSGIYKELEYKRQAVTQYGADDFFQKPLNRDNLRRRVFELLEMGAPASAASEAAATMEFPAADTSKMPSVRQPDKEDSGRFSSHDLFGDIIEKVESEDELPVVEHRPETPPRAAEPGRGQKQTARDADRQPAAKGSGRTEEESVLDLTDADMIPPKTVKIPSARQSPSSFKGITNEDIDASLSNLLSKEPAKAPDTRRFKKIEEDFSRKFEETLSGLGLDKKEKKSAPPPKAAAKITQPPQRPPQSAPAAPPPDLRTQEMPRPPAQPPRESSSELGNYDILGLIARGGMAEIYKAKKKGVKGFEKILAIKKILSGYGQDDKYIEMFVDEAKIAAELTHPNIVQIYDLGKKDDYYFIAMEFVQGKDLRVILKRLSALERRFPEELGIYMIIKVLEALSYAHSAKDSRGRNLDIVHRDISPPNIMISYGGEVKLTDFGVSKATIKVHQTLSGALKGKLLYMSPEQARADRDIDHRSDLYSVGIILFELLTGQKLFLEPSEMKVLKRVQQGQITTPAQAGMTLDAELERILLKSLNLKREDRYQSASDMLSDLESYLLARYDHIPGYLHLAHFMKELFAEDMTKDGVKSDLKPLPYRIQRLPQQAVPPAGEPLAAEEEEPSLDTIHFEPTLPEDAAPTEEVREEPVISIEPDIEFEPLEEPSLEAGEPFRATRKDDRPAEAPPPVSGDAPVEPPPVPPGDEPLRPPGPGERNQAHGQAEPETGDQAIPPPEPVDEVKVSAPPASGSGAPKGAKGFQPTYEIELGEEPESGKDSIRIDEELAALDRRSGRRSRGFLIILAALAAVAAGVVWYMMNRTGTPPAVITPPPANEARTTAPQPAPVPEEVLAETDGTQTDKTEEGAAAGTEAPAGESAAPTPEPSTAKPTREAQTPPQTPQRQEARSQVQQTPAPASRREAAPRKPGGETAAATRKTAQETTPPPPEKPQTSQSESRTQPQPSETAPPAGEGEPSAETAAKPQAVQPEPAEVKPEPPQEIVKEGQLATSVDTMPIAVSTPYPALNRRALKGLKKTTTVVISFLVNHKGKVERIKFIRRSGVPEIDMHIARTVSNWTYRPAIKQNKKVKVWQTKSITIKK